MYIHHAADPTFPPGSVPVPSLFRPSLSTLSTKQTALVPSRYFFFLIKSSRIHRCKQVIPLTPPQIRDAIERLVGLLQGEEGHQTKADQVDELVKGIKGTSVAGAATGAVAGVETSTVSQDDGSDSELDVMEV